MKKVITVEKLQKFYDDLKVKIKNNHYTKTEIDNKLSNMPLDISNLLDKTTYDADNDGIVDKAKLIDGMTKEDLDKMIRLLTLLQSSNPQQYLGTNIDNQFGLYYFPTNQEGHNSIEQKVALNVNIGDTITIESVANMQEQKAFVQVYKYVEGESDVINTIKEFNNANKDNFICSNDVTFNDSCHIKNEYTLESILNSDNFYEITINKTEFLSLVGINSEVNN